MRDTISGSCCNKSAGIFKPDACSRKSQLNCCLISCSSAKATVTVVVPVDTFVPVNTLVPVDTLIPVEAVLHVDFVGFVVSDLIDSS
jgi:hypothetical protein